MCVCVCVCVCVVDFLVQMFSISQLLYPLKTICFEAIQNDSILNSCSIEQRSVIKLLLADKYKLCEIYRRMRDVYGKACFSKKCL